MRFIYIFVGAVMLLFAQNVTATIYTVTTPGFSFSPASLTINLGDTVNFSLGLSHNAVEVSQTTWNSGGNTSNGGFQTPYGGGIVIPQNPGVYYYVCVPHASMGMKGTITVAIPSLTTGSVSPLTYCAGDNITVPFSVTGAFSAANVFTAQLSNAAGSFASPVNLGTLTGSSTGQITGSIPVQSTPGAGYRVRVISNDPALTASANTADIALLARPTAAITPSTAQSICQGYTAALTANAGSGFSYTWKRNNTIIPGATGQVYDASQSGTYTVVVSNGTCSATSAGVLVNVYPTDPTKLTWTGSTSANWSDPGNWDNPCAVPTAGDSVIIPSGIAAPQSIPAVSLSQLVLNNAAGITLTNAMQISGSLVLSGGVITLGDNHLSLASSATISGGAAASFIVTNGLGELRQAGIGSGARSGAVLFPVGATAAGYSPLVITNAGTADEFRLRVRNELLAEGTGGTAISAYGVQRTWLLTESTPGGSDATVTLQWDASAEMTSFDRTSSYIARHTGSAWEAKQGTGPATGSNPYQRSVSGVSAFGPFAIGDGNSTLPLQLAHFSASISDNNVRLSWETMNEVACQGFGIERRDVAAGSSWENVGFMPAANQPRNTYRYEDLHAAQIGASSLEYRLRMIDADGRVTFSPVVTVNLTAIADAVSLTSLSPLPAVDEVTVRFSLPAEERVSLAMYNMLGAKVMQYVTTPVFMPGSHAVSLPTSGLTTGTYLLELRAGNTMKSALLTVRR
jgi:plastocyanin